MEIKLLSSESVSKLMVIRRIYWNEVNITISGLSKYLTQSCYMHVCVGVSLLQDLVMTRDRPIMFIFYPLRYAAVLKNLIYYAQNYYAQE